MMLEIAGAIDSDIARRLEAAPLTHHVYPTATLLRV